MRARRLLAVVGATCSGKTSLSVALAEHLRGELVNADSRQAIEEVSVGVCKPTELELRGIPCHGLDWRHLGEPYSVADFVTRAKACLTEVWGRGRLPILVGGSGLYVRALLQGFDFGGVAPADGGVPANSEGRALDQSTAAAALLALAPGRAAVVDLTNPRRVKRALELARAGAEASWVDQGWTPIRIGCQVSAELLKSRIRSRTERIVGPELRDEVAALLGRGLEPATVANSAIGYAEALAWAAGQCTRAEAVDRLATRTWKYARTQMTWLRSERDVVWIDASGDTQDMVAACRAALASIWPQEHW